MKISLDTGTGATRITAYEDGSITINDETVHSAVIVHADGYRLWAAEAIDSLTEELLIFALQDKPDILLLGTGVKQHFPSPHLMKPVAESGAGLEVMDTAAACRTYNILMSEDRHVVAALLL
jgi:uncharacterized protein